MTHEPHPFFTLDTHKGMPVYGGGVRCTCGSEFKIGDKFPDTDAGNTSKRPVKTMKHCWELFRRHWRPG